MCRMSVGMVVLALLVIAYPGAATKGKSGTAPPGPNLAEIRPAARERMKPYFERQRVNYPPRKVRLVGLKKEERLKVYAQDRTGEWRLILQYPVVSASGTLGPKMREGDMQVPEGIYRVTYFNPESRFHLSLGLDYPNDFDRRQARKEKRKGKLGGEIMIHGGWQSSGCLAMGDTAAEDLYVLVSDVGLANTRVILSPRDFRAEDDDLQTTGTSASSPAWTKELYAELEKQLEELGDHGVSTSTVLVQYADARVPLPPVTEPDKLAVTGIDLAASFAKVVEALSKAAETSATLHGDGLIDREEPKN